MKKYAILTFVVVVMAVCAGIVGYIVSDNLHSRESLEALQETAYSSTEYTIEETFAEPVTQASTASATKPEAKTANKDNNAAVAKNSVDISKLQKTNPDIFAWISIPGTVLDYPVAQHPTDDTYYLKHGADGLKSNHGCPFIEMNDSKKLDEFNTVFYGHNMNDGSMFAALHKYEDKDFADKHRQILVYTSEHVYSYKVFSAVMYSDTWIPGKYNDMLQSDRTAFLDSLKTDIVKNRSFNYDDIKVTEKNRIITLSTCDKKLRNNRFIVVAVLEKIDGRDA